LFCPTCDKPIIYRQTVYNGVSPKDERWDYFQCGTCGVLEYRHRTRKLRRIDMLPFSTAALH
jgi:hypothetical protein